jgi:hypothetical protein
MGHAVFVSRRMQRHRSKDEYGKQLLASGMTSYSGRANGLTWGERPPLACEDICVGR